MNQVEAIAVRERETVEVPSSRERGAGPSGTGQANNRDSTTQLAVQGEREDLGF